MKPICPIVCATAFLLPSALADIITLRDGQKLEGEILEKTEDEYVLSVQVTKSIREQKTVKRSDVVDIKRESKSDTAFEAIADLTPAPPFLSSKDYDERIQKVRIFLAKHRLSPSSSKAKEMLKELEKERRSVSAGGIKTEEGIISATEFKEDEATLTSLIELSKIKTAASKRAFIPAFRIYDSLQADLYGTKGHRDAIPVVKSLMANYRQVLTSELNNFARNEQRKNEVFKSLSADEQTRARLAEEQRFAKYEQVRKRELQAEERWLTVNLLDQRSIEETIGMLQSEISQLSSAEANLAASPDSGELFKNALAAAKTGERNSLEPLLVQLETIKIGQTYLDTIVNTFFAVVDAKEAEEGQQSESTN